MTIRSNASIPGLQPLPQDLDEVTFQFDMGPEPEWMTAATGLPHRILLRDPSFTLTEYGNGKCYDLSYSEGARFVFDDSSKRLWGTFRPPLTIDDLYVYLLGPVMGFLLRHRHITCLHASAVELNDRAVLFSGDPGYGKSTTAAALAIRGFPVLAEDIVPLEPMNNGFLAIPGYPRVCLWPDAVSKLFGHGSDLPRLSSTWDKRYLPLDGVRARFAREKKPLGIIYLFGDRSNDSRAPFIEELGPREAVLGLVQNTYMNWLIDRQRRAKEFDDLCKIVQEVPVRRIVAHTDGAKLADLCERIFEDAGSILAKV